MCNTIRHEMERRGITKAELAKMTGISYSTIHDLYNGKFNIDRMTVGVLAKLASVFDMSLDALYNGGSTDSADEAAYLAAYKACSDDGRRAMVAMAMALAREFPREW